MEAHQNQRNCFSDSAGEAPVWRAFLFMAGVQSLWFAFGAYLVGIGTTLLDPVFLLAFGVASFRVIRRTWSYRGMGLSMQGLVCLVAFLASVVFVSTRTQIGFGDTVTTRLIITVLDASTGDPLGKAHVTASDGRGNVAEGITSDRGMITLEFETLMFTTHSWVLSQRSFKPGIFTIESSLRSYANSKKNFSLPIEHRIHLINKSFKSRQDQIIRAEIKLTRTIEAPH